jgi:tetratricopeptide (TPR) repeat protein
MRAALDWASANDVELALELLVSLENFWNQHAPDEVVGRLDGLLPRAGEVPPALRASALRVRGGALHILGDFQSCDPPYGESLALFRELGDERGIAQLTERLANSASRRGELERAQELALESLERSHGRFPFIEIPAYTLLGRVRVMDGDVEGGTELIRRAEAMAADLGWDWWRAGCLARLADLALDRGDVDEAERDGREALRLIRVDENRAVALLPLTVLARVALEQGELRRAGLLWGAVEAEGEQAPDQWWRGRSYEPTRSLLDEHEPEFVAGVEDGRRLDLWEAAALALGEVEPA